MTTLVTCRNQIIPTAARSIAVAAALCCAGLAIAQTAPSVTLYGLVDVGITSVSGLKNGTVTQVASGIMEGSRWGLKGNEDLGDGYKAIFTLESRFEADTGALSNRPISGSKISDRFSQAKLLGLPDALQNAVLSADGKTGVAKSIADQSFGVNLTNNLFDRQAFVGLVTPFGGFLAGRQYTPGYETFAAYDITNTQSALSAGQTVQIPGMFTIRTSNALAYRIVKDGISGSLMYAPGEVAGDSAARRLLGINANYKTSAFSVGLGYNTSNNENGDKSLTATVLGASMNFGSSKVSALVSKMTDDNPSNFSGPNGIAASVLPGLTAAFRQNPAFPTQAVADANAAGAANSVQNAYINAFKQDGTLFHIGYQYVTGPNTISVAYSKYDDKRAANADTASYGVAYSYALSKRTDLNAVAVHFNNTGLAQSAPGGNGYLGGVTSAAGVDSNSFAFGIRHRF